MGRIFLISILSFFITGACDRNSTSPAQGTVDPDEIYSGGVPRDGIPALVNPEIMSADNAGYLLDSDLVIGVVVSGEARAYPIKIMNYHEIANDVIRGQSIAVTYCPLTGSGLVSSRVFNGQESEFGVSGLLFRNNLIPYDRRTESLYSQMYARGIRGDHNNENWLLYPSVECEWGFWKDQYPETKVLSINTGYQRPYSENPYGDYPTSYSTLFPIVFPDNRYHPKEKTLGAVIDGQAMAFPATELFSGRLANVTFNGEPIVIVYEPGAKLMTAFSRVVEGDTLSFSRANNFGSNMIDDQTGTTWSVMGLATEGELAGTSLVQFPFYSAYWFAWHDFYPETEVYTD